EEAAVYPRYGNPDDYYVLQDWDSSPQRNWARGIMTYLGQPTRPTRYTAYNSDLFAADLGPADTQFCYLTAMSGKFRGSESIGIYRWGSTHWHLQAYATGSETSYAQAACVPY